MKQCLGKKNGKLLRFRLHPLVVANRSLIDSLDTDKTKMSPQEFEAVIRLRANENVFQFFQLNNQKTRSKIKKCGCYQKILTFCRSQLCGYSLSCAHRKITKQIKKIR